MSYHLSRYVISFAGEGDKTILHNTYNGKVAQLPTALFEKANALNDYAALQTLFHPLGQAGQSILDDYFVAEDDDIEALKKLLMRNKYSSDTLAITIMTTLNCNLACVYCYQQGIVDPSLHLSEKTALMFGNWVISKIDEVSPRKIVFHFYGGEPLMNLSALDKVMPRIINYADERHIDFSSYITTNGILLNKKNLARLKKWKIISAQISIDGPERIHDMRRPFKDGKGSYHIIMENIRSALQEKLQIMLRLNLDRQNYLYAEQLFTELHDMKLPNTDLLHVKIETVSPIMNPSVHCNQYTFTSDQELALLCGLWKKQVANGFKIHSVMPVDSACENMRKHAYTISSDGRIYPCPGFIGIEGFEVGNIQSGLDTDRLEHLLSINPWENCLECTYAPVCQGGCRMCAYVTSKKCDALYCRKSFYEAIYPEFIKCKYGIR